MPVLYLASQSYSRHMLLRQAGISFETIEHEADEHVHDWNASLYDIVRELAASKMEHVQLPDHDGDVFYVLTADTLSVDQHGNKHGKPVDYTDAVEKIQALRDGSTVSTGFCVRKYARANGQWTVQDEHSGVVSAETRFYVPDNWIDAYLMHQPHALSANGAIAIEGYGSQFLQRVHGSYTTIVGLPLFEVRTALEQLGFFS